MGICPFIRPGITDPASVIFRHEESILAESEDPETTYRDEILPHKLDLYEDYIRTRSLVVDGGILLQTFWAVLFR